MTLVGYQQPQKQRVREAAFADAVASLNPRPAIRVLARRATYVCAPALARILRTGSRGRVVLRSLPARCAHGPSVLATLPIAHSLPEPVRAALGQANGLDTVLEPGLSHFGNPDGIVVLRQNARALGALYVEAKRGPLLCQWSNAVSGKRADSWASSHLVVQTARKWAFLAALSQSPEPRTPVSFAAAADYWRGADGRTMCLEKPTVLALLKETLTLSGVVDASVVLTLTASAWNWPGRSLPGDDAYGAILRAWKLPPQAPCHLGFDELYRWGDHFPLLRRTIQLNLWDMVAPAAGWEDWVERVSGPDLFGPDPLARLRAWAASQSVTLCLPARAGGPYGRGKRNRKVCVRLFGYCGPGGPLLALDVARGHTLPLPEGWKRWALTFGVTERPPTTTQWDRHLLVPREWGDRAVPLPPAS